MFSDAVVELSNIMARLNISLDLGKLYSEIPTNFPCFCVKYASSIRLCALRDEYSTKNIKSSFNTSFGVNRYQIKLPCSWVLKQYRDRYKKYDILLGKLYPILMEEEIIEFRLTFKFTNPNVIQISGMKLYESNVIKRIVKYFLRELQQYTGKKISYFQNETVKAKGILFEFPILKLKKIKVKKSYTCLVKSKIELLDKDRYFIDLMELLRLIEKNDGDEFIGAPNQEKDYSKIIIVFQDSRKITKKEWKILQGGEKIKSKGVELEKAREILLRHRKNPTCVKMSAFCRLIHVNSKTLFRNLRAIHNLLIFIEKHADKIIKKK